MVVADSKGPDAARGCLQSRTGITTVRQQPADKQYGRNEFATHLLNVLGSQANDFTFSQWGLRLICLTSERAS